MMKQTLKRLRGGNRRGFTLTEILIVAIITPILVGGALLYLNSGLTLTDAAQHHAMNQQAMRVPFLRVSRLVEYSEELEILSGLPATLAENSTYIYLNSDDHSIYLRSLSGDVAVDDKIPGFERVADVAFTRVVFTSDGEAKTSADEGVRMEMTARGGPRLADSPRTAKKDVPGLTSITDMRSMNQAGVHGLDAGPVLRIETNVLGISAELFQFDSEEGLKFDATGRLQGKIPEGRGMGLEEQFFGQYTLDKGDVERVAYEWRVYDFDATAGDIKSQNEAKYKVIGRDSDYQNATLNKHYDSNKPLTGLLGDEGFGFSCIPDPNNKPTDNVIRANMLVPEPIMEGHMVAFAAGDPDKPRSTWSQSEAYRVYDVGVFGTNLKNQLAADLKNKNGISDRVLLNKPDDGAASPQDRITDIRMEYDEETQQSYIAIDGIGNIEIPFLSGKLARRYFPHSRVPMMVDDGKGGKKQVWVRSREFCPENYTIWIDAKVGDGNSDDMAGYGLTLNGNTSRDLTAKIDRVYGYMFQYDPGMAGYGGGPEGTPAWWHVGGGHVKANGVGGYSWDKARNQHLDAAFEYYFNRSVFRHFMDLAPKDRPHGIAEGLLVRELQGGTNGPLRGVSDVLRYHKVPGGMANDKNPKIPDVDEENSKKAGMPRYSVRKVDPTNATLNTLPVDQIRRTDAENDGKGKYYNATDGRGRGVKIGDLVYYDIETANRKKSSHVDVFKTYKKDGTLVAELNPTSSSTNALSYYPNKPKDQSRTVYTQWRVATDLDAGQYYTRANKGGATEDKDTEGNTIPVSALNYLKDRFVVKAIDQNNDNNGWGMKYYQWGDLSYWAQAAEYWLVSDDYCDEYGKVFGMEPVDQAAYDAYLRNFDPKTTTNSYSGEKRFKSMVGQKYTVAISVVTQTKAAPGWEWDPEQGKQVWNADRTVPTNMFCRVRVYDGPRRRVLERDQRPRQDAPDRLESEFRLANGDWDTEKFTVRRFEDGTARSRDAWFGFMASFDADGKNHWIPNPVLPNQTDASNLKNLIDSRKAPDMWYKGPEKEENAFIWSPRREMSFWQNVNHKISDRTDGRPTAGDTWGYMGWTWRQYHWSVGDDYYLPKDVLELVAHHPDKWWMSNADRRYYYIKMNDNIPLVTENNRKTVAQVSNLRQPAIQIGPNVSGGWSNYQNAIKNDGQTVANRRTKTFDLSDIKDANGNSLYSYMGADKMKSLKLPYVGAGFPIFPGDYFYRIEKDALMTEKKIAYRKSGQGYVAEPGADAVGASSIGQDIALRMFAPRNAPNNRKFTAKIYYFDVEKGFSEDYVFPWGTKLVDLLPDGKGSTFLQKARGDWNWFEPFQPVDGVKETNEERINDN